MVMRILKRSKSAPHLAQGRWAEQQAQLYLTKSGLRYVQSNYRCPHGEIDLIMLDNGCLVFVEVRARRFGGLVTAAESFDAEKYRRVRRCALLYQHRHNLHQFESVIHLVTVTWHRGLPSMQMFGIDDSLAS